MKKTLLTLSVFCFITLGALSQNKYLEGYVVTLSKDTIRGYLYDNDTDWKSKAIEFKTTLTAESKSFPIDELNSFYLKDLNNYFYIRTLEVDKKPIRIDQLKSNANPKIVTETIIIKLLASGKINLFGYVDENSKRHFFIQKDNDEIKELGYLKFLTSFNKIIERPYYIGTLKFMTKDCPQIKFNTVSYEETALQKLVDKYNSCFTETRYIKKGEGVKLSVGVLVGAKSSSFDYKANSDVGLAPNQKSESVKFTTATTATMGFYIDLKSKRVRTPFAVCFQSLYQQAGTFSAITQPVSSYYFNFKSKLSYLTISLGIKYNLTKNNTGNLYVLTGIGFNHLVKYTAEVSYSDPTSPQQFLTFRKDNLDYYLGFGYSYRRANLELRGVHDFFSAAFADGGAKILSANLVLGYRIF